MTLDFAGILRDAGRLFRRDRDLLLRVGLPLLFLPLFALFLTIPDPPLQPEAATQAVQLAWATQYAEWMTANGPWYVLGSLVCYYGLLTIISLYALPARPTLGTAMLSALKLFPRYLLAMLLVGSMVTGIAALLIALAALTVPVLGLVAVIPLVFWLLGRFYPVGPALVAERPIGAVRAVGAAFRRTRGHGLVLAGLSGLTLAAGVVLGQPFLWLGTMLQQAHAANPVALALVDAGAALASAASLLAMALLQVSAYRRLTAAG